MVILLFLPHTQTHTCSKTQQPDSCFVCLTSHTYCYMLVCLRPTHLHLLAGLILGSLELWWMEVVSSSATSSLKMSNSCFSLYCLWKNTATVEPYFGLRYWLRIFFRGTNIKRRLIFPHTYKWSLCISACTLLFLPREIWSLESSFRKPHTVSHVLTPTGSPSQR